MRRIQGLLRTSLSASTISIVAQAPKSSILQEHALSANLIIMQTRTRRHAFKMNARAPKFTVLSVHVGPVISFLDLIQIRQPVSTTRVPAKRLKFWMIKDSVQIVKTVLNQISA